jgi:hypothetical protein
MLSNQLYSIKSVPHDLDIMCLHHVDGENKRQTPMWLIALEHFAAYCCGEHFEHTHTHTYIYIYIYIYTHTHVSIQNGRERDVKMEVLAN